MEEKSSDWIPQETFSWTDRPFQVISAPDIFPNRFVRMTDTGVFRRKDKGKMMISISIFTYSTEL
jgi:hypothetical protein